MPRPLPWNLVSDDLSENDAELLLQGMKSWQADKSQLMTCSTCNHGELHKMRYKTLRCACKHCTNAAPYSKCPWRLKLLLCSETKRVVMYEIGAHISSVASQKKKALTVAQRAFLQDLARENLKPVRILHALTRKFELSVDELPPLRSIQNVVNHFRRTVLGGNDRRAEIAAQVERVLFGSQEDDNAAFAFGVGRDASGKVVLGNGSDTNPFFVGITATALLRNADRDPSSFVLHVDATFKLSQIGYPVIVCGISDAARTFHLVAIFVTSQLQGQHYVAALEALQSIFARVCGERMKVQYIMVDADRAQLNALAQVFRDSTYQILMCFYHVLAKVRERTRSLSDDDAALAYKGVYDLHFSLSAREFATRKERVMFEWRGRPALDEFRLYMAKQWLNGPFQNWQCYLTPPGFATTNNPCEQFNRSLKRDYTQRQQLKMGFLLQQLLACCAHRAMSQPTFQIAPANPPTLRARVAALQRRGFLRTVEANRNSISFLVEDVNPSIVRVLSVSPPRTYVPARNRSVEALEVTAQLGVHYARMEVEGQPRTGWPVNVETRYCPCRMHFKFKYCVHLSFALKMVSIVDDAGDEVLVNRKRRRVTETTSAGRPEAIGHALTRL